MGLLNPRASSDFRAYIARLQCRDLRKNASLVQTLHWFLTELQSRHEKLRVSRVI